LQAALVASIGYWGKVVLPCAYLKQTKTIEELIERGLSAAIHTQITDVENELNGLLSYDRKVFKIPAKNLAPVHKRVIQSMER